MANKVMKTMDGNTATGYISYTFTDVAAIYPITPSSPMAEVVDDMAAHGETNIFGPGMSVGINSYRIPLCPAISSAFRISSEKL